MLTDDLRDAMNQATAEQPFVPDIERALGRARRLRTRQRLTVVTSVTVIAVLAAGLTLTITSGSGKLTPADSAPAIGLGGIPVAPTTAETVAAFANWGPTRGNLADDPEFTTAVAQRWEHPAKNDAVPDGTSIARKFGGTATVLYAGTTPDGVAAVVDQRVGNGLDVGLMFGATKNSIHIVDEQGTGFGATNAQPGLDPTYSFYSGDENGNELWLDPWVVSFVTSESGQHVLILPVNSGDSIEASFSHTLDSDGQIQRTWSPVTTTGGVGIATEPSDGLAYDTLVRVTHDGSPVDVSPVFTTFDLASQPSNLLGRSWIGTDPRPPGEDARESIVAINNVANVGFFDSGNLANTGYDWVHSAYGTDESPYPAEPFGSDLWQVSGDVARHWWVNVEQEWLWGDPAHTVVTLEHDGGGAATTSEQIVSDSVSDVNARPFVATKLPRGFGWIVVAGPGSTITGYRVAGNQPWSVPKAANFDNRGDTPKVGTTRKAAILPTSASSLEIRMDVNGQTTVVDEASAKAISGS